MSAIDVTGMETGDPRPLMVTDRSSRKLTKAMTAAMMASFTRSRRYVLVPIPRSKPPAVVAAVAATLLSKVAVSTSVVTAPPVVPDCEPDNRIIAVLLAIITVLVATLAWVTLSNWSFPSTSTSPESEMVTEPEMMYIPPASAPPPRTVRTVRVQSQCTYVRRLRNVGVNNFQGSCEVEDLEWR